MENTLIIALLILNIFLVGLTFLFLRKASGKGRENEGMVFLQNQINEITKTLDARLSESTRVLQSQFGESAKIVRDVTERLTKLDETNKQVIGFADQLKNLQDILKRTRIFYLCILSN